MKDQANLFKQWFDKFLVINFFVVIAGGLLFVFGVIATATGFDAPYQFFQSLWFPLFIPAISLFFTAVLIEALWRRLQKEEE